MRRLPRPFYRDAWVTLYQGDIRELGPLLPAPAVVVTDPPYGIRYQAGDHGASWARGRIAGDDSPELARWIADRWPGPTAMFGSYKVPPPFQPNATLVWSKGLACGMGDLAMPWKPNWELVWIRGRTWHGRRTTSVLHFPIVSRESLGRLHPTEKPVELLVELVAKAPPGLLLDPCAGSGPALEAARRLGRPAIGVELEERWCAAAVKRFRRAA